MGQEEPSTLKVEHWRHPLCYNGVKNLSQSRKKKSINKDEF